MSWHKKDITLYLALSYLVFLICLSVFSNQILSIFDLTTSGNINRLNVEPWIKSSNILGTNHQGQDLLALMISGTRYSLTISFFSAFFAVIIGILIGSTAGYFGDKGVQLKRFQVLSAILILPLTLFYLFLSLEINGWMSVGIALFLGIVVSYLLWKFFTFSLKKIKYLHAPINLPIDILNTKISEVVFAIPSYFIILSFSSFLGDSIWTIVFVLGITSWPQSALLIRAEMLKIREMNYMDALKLSGLGHIRILFFHGIPNAISPVLVNFVFFISGLLIVESTLSYVGIGFSSDIYTWGKIISGFKSNSANWWVAVYPGAIIFLTILSFHRIGHWAEKRLL